MRMCYPTRKFVCSNQPELKIKGNGVSNNCQVN